MDAAGHGRAAGVLARVAPLQAALEGDRHEQSVAAEAAVAAHRPAGRHYYLGALGTLPARQRRGAVQRCCARCCHRASTSSTPAVLDTCIENVAFYSAIGFGTVAEVTVPDGGPKVWVMARAPSG